MTDKSAAVPSCDIALYKGNLTVALVLLNGSLLYCYFTELEAEEAEVYAMGLQGLILLSKWTSIVQELVSCKLLNPNMFHGRGAPEGATDYERVSCC